jgi:hypothetical protein
MLDRSQGMMVSQELCDLHFKTFVVYFAIKVVSPSLTDQEAP